MKNNMDILQSKLTFILGIIVPIAVLVMIFSATAASPWFSWQNNALSDLGTSEVGILFNSALILAGGFTILFALHIRKYKLKNVDIIALVFAGASLTLVGIFTVEHPFHIVFSVLYFMLYPVAMIIIGLKISGRYGIYRTFTVGSGLVALIAILIPHQGLAIPEILQAMVIIFWVIASSLYFYRKM